MRPASRSCWSPAPTLLGTCLQAARYLINGADLLLPGVRAADASVAALPAGAAACVRIFGNPSAVAVGVLAVPGAAVAEAVRSPGAVKGTALQVEHVVGDALWRLAGRPLPNSGFVVAEGGGVSVAPVEAADDTREAERDAGVRRPVARVASADASEADAEGMPLFVFAQAHAGQCQADRLMRMGRGSEEEELLLPWLVHTVHRAAATVEAEGRQHRRVHQYPRRRRHRRHRTEEVRVPARRSGRQSPAILRHRWCSQLQRRASSGRRTSSKL